MKTITAILITFLLAALVLFAITAGKAVSGPQPEDELPIVEEIPEIPEEELEPEIDPEMDPGTQQQEEEEESDPEAITAIEIYLDGPRDDGILLGEAQFGLTSREVNLEMIEKKTSALISGALESGAVLGIERNKLDGFRKFGKYLGIAFQITDDILGIWGNDKKTGKPQGNDIRKKKKSLPIVFCMEEGKDKVALKLKGIYSKKRISGRAVKTVLTALGDCQAQKFCEEQAENYYGLALKELEKLPVKKEYAGHYAEIAQFLIKRDF